MVSTALHSYNSYHLSPELRMIAEGHERFVRDAQAYADTAEARGEARGREEGLAEGEAKGLAKGEIKGKLDTLIRILTKRLGALPESTAAKIKSLDNLDDIDRLSDIALDVPSFDEFTKQLG